MEMLKQLPTVVGKAISAFQLVRSNSRIGLVVSMLAMVLTVGQAEAQVPSDSIVLEGDYISTGVSNNGTLGVGGNIHPGFIFDETGTGNFNTANDYLTPGSPFEGFSISYAGSGGYISNNNAGNTVNIGTAAAPVAVDSFTSGYDHAALWSGTLTGVLTIEHLYGLNQNSKIIDVTTTITALTDIDDLKFARYIDPDSGGTTTINTRGNATLNLAPENWINSEGVVNGATLGIYSVDDVSHNTAVSPGWSEDPDTYLAGSADSTGDYVIGMGFYIGTLLDLHFLKKSC